MFIERIFVGFICVFLMVGVIGFAQSPAEPGIDVSIALKIDGHTYTFNGRGECTYAPEAYIYSTKAQQWRVAGSNDEGSVSLTLWRPADGSGEMFSFYAATDRASHVVKTVQTSEGGEPEGSGRVTFTPDGPGGTFTISATAAPGAAISGNLKCSSFGAEVAEGG